MKRTILVFSLLFISLLNSLTALAQSYTDKVRQFERLLREWKSDGYSTGSEKYTQLMSMVTEGCRMSEYVAKSYIDDNNASTFDIKAGSWFQYIKEKKISISLRDLQEKTDEDRKPIVYCWITYTQPGRSDKKDFVGFKFDGGKFFYICNDDMERANRIKSDNESNDNNIVTSDDNVPYAVFRDGTLTLYYGNTFPDDAIKIYTGKVIDDFWLGKYPETGWYLEREKITTVVFDKSFSDYRPLDCSYWFCECANLVKINGMREYLNTTNVSSMSRMFYSCKNLTSIDVRGFNTTNVTNMSGMFAHCENLENLDIGNFNTTIVSDMSCMFTGCEHLTSLDVSKMNTENVTNMHSMFSSCWHLTSLDLSSLNTSHVLDMSYMFYKCISLTNLKIRGWNTTNVMNMESMFGDCYRLDNLDVSCFNTANVERMTGMFGGCENITRLDISNFNTAKVWTMDWMFQNCSKLTTIYVSDKWNTDRVQKACHEYMFEKCSELVGGNNTCFDPQKIDKSYARIDGGPSAPGYFTRQKNMTDTMKERVLLFVNLIKELLDSKVSDTQKDKLVSNTESILGFRHGSKVYKDTETYLVRDYLMSIIQESKNYFTIEMDAIDYEDLDISEFKKIDDSTFIGSVKFDVNLHCKQGFTNIERSYYDYTVKNIKQGYEIIVYMRVIKTDYGTEYLCELGDVTLRF
jgi:surface protein